MERSLVSLSVPANNATGRLEVQVVASSAFVVEEVIDSGPRVPPGTR
jgi:hypothetical protein